MSIQCVKVGSVIVFEVKIMQSFSILVVFLVTCSWKIAYKMGIWETLFTSVIEMWNTSVKSIWRQRKYCQTENLTLLRIY